MKAIDLSDVEEDKKAKIMNEIDVLSSLDHENLLHFKEYLEENNRIYIVTELLSGGDIVGAVLKQDPYTEADAQLFFSKLFKGEWGRSQCLRCSQTICSCSHPRTFI